MNKNSTEAEDLVKVGISMGDPNGIGPEVIMKCFLDNRMFQVCSPVIYGSSKVLSFHRKVLGYNELNLTNVRDVENLNPKALNVFNVTEEDFKVELGMSSNTAGNLAFRSLEAAVNDLKSKKIDVLVTAPINKKNIQSESFKFPGHTEYLTEQFGATDSLMLMVSEGLRVATLTGHLPLSQVSSSISMHMILHKIKILNRSLIEDFGVRRPRIAIMGLNPHAGDSGLLGSEEQEIIIPAINKLKEEGILAFGPYSADGLFGSAAFNQFDAIVSMYHDQGLVPFKALAFETGVNYTAGLPIVRTSPDHGTGYDIAGKDQASESSMRSAIYVACDIFKKRLEFRGLTTNPLKVSALKKERT